MKSIADQFGCWIRSAPWVVGFAVIASLITVSFSLGILRMPRQAALTLKGHSLAVMSVAFSPDGKRLASDSNHQTVKVWYATLRP